MIPSMDWTDAEGRVSLLAAAPIVVLVAEVAHASVHTLQERVHIAHHLTSLCALGVCAQTACCCSSLRSARPRRSWKLQSIALEYALPRDASCASHRKRCLPRRVYSSWCTAVVVAPWPDLSGCVMLVSVRMGGYQCVLAVYGASEAHGPVGYRCRAFRGVFLHA